MRGWPWWASSRRCPRSRPCPLARPRRRRIHLGQWVEAPVYDLEALAPGQAIAGPAVLETATTTVLLRPADRAVVTPLGWLDVTLV